MELIGINERASEFIKGCPAVVYDTTPEGFDLYEYTLNTGGKVREVVQISKVKTGLTFLCLEERGVKMFRWTDIEMSKEVSQNV